MGGKLLKGVVLLERDVLGHLLSFVCFLRHVMCLLLRSGVLDAKAGLQEEAYKMSVI